jgi:hypothetical protein
VHRIVGARHPFGARVIPEHMGDWAEFLKMRHWRQAWLVHGPTQVRHPIDP